MTAKRIIGVGSPLLDILSGVEDSFLAGVRGGKGGMENFSAAELDALLNALPEKRTAPGGAAGNTIFGLAHLGLPAAMLGKTGRDGYGAFYRERLAKLGGDASAFRIDDETPTGRCVSLITPDSERTMRTDLGAALKLTPEDVDGVDFSQYDVVYIEGYMLFNAPTFDAIVRAAKAAHCELALDLASYEVVGAFRDKLRKLLDDAIDLLFANEREAAAFCGEMPEERMARELAKSCRVATVKVGKKGAYIAAGEELHRIEPQLVKAVDTTGAGDLWTTGFFYGYLNGMPLEKCGAFGAITSREVVQIVGADIPEERWSVIRRELGVRD